jgi:hypothetical protein
MKSHSKLLILHFDFPNTSGNHAGMSYFARRIAESLPGARAIRQPLTYFPGGSIFQFVFVVLVALRALWSLRASDTLFLLEYATPVAQQPTVAKICRFFGAKFRIAGLVHLSLSHLLEVHPDAVSLGKQLALPDHIVVFGSSLERDLHERFGRKSIRTFHYVDADYYSPTDLTTVPDRLRVIVMGALKRSFDDLPQIVKSCPAVEFHICCGKTDRSAQFAGIPNGVLHGFLSEAQLRDLMKSCHVGLSILEDTIGSNVIVTSLACGLVNVVSDVGSIRDYCSESNSIFCRSNAEFQTAIATLAADKALLQRMRQSARTAAEGFSLPRSLEWIQRELTQEI